MPDKHLRNLAESAVRRLQSTGFTAYFAGGCVRDILMNRTPKDYDIVTNASPSQVENLFPGSKTSGKSFAVTRSPIDSVYFEIATFREDHGYTDGRRPDRISFSDAKTDAERRDFTINAMFYDPVKQELHDFAGGRNDLANRIIRCVGEPEKRFGEDHLRMLRAVRFASSLAFSLDPVTADAIRKHASALGRISAERIRDELIRILTEAEKPDEAILLMDNLNMLEIILPEVTAMKNQAQPPEFHPEGDVFTHTIKMLGMMKQPSLHLAFAALFHDVGKPLTATSSSDRIRFNGHAEQGALIAENMMRRLRFPTSDTESICYCIKNHMRFMDVQKMKKSTLRRLVGAPTFPVELELHRLDCLASHGDLSNWQFLVEFQKKLTEEPVLPEPWINGADIIKMGIPESPLVGILRTKAYEAQLNSQFKNREELLAWLKNEARRTDPK